MTGPGTPGKVGLAGQARQEHTKPNRGRAHFNQPNLVRAQPQNRAVERAGAYSTWSRRSSRFRSSSDRVTARQRGEAAREGVVAQPRRRVRLTPPQQRRRHTRAQSALARRCRIRGSRRGGLCTRTETPPPPPLPSPTRPSSQTSTSRFNQPTLYPCPSFSPNPLQAQALFPHA